MLSTEPLLGRTPLDPALDAAILSGAQEGQPTALSRLAEQFGGIDPLVGHRNAGGLMRTLAKKACRSAGLRPDSDTVQEVVAETYCQVLRPDIARFSPGKSTVPQYLLGLARNAAKKIRALRSCRPVGVENCADENAPTCDDSRTSVLRSLAIHQVQVREAVLSDPADIVEAAEEGELRHCRLAGVLAHVEPVLASAVRRHYWEGVSVCGIAKEMGVDRRSLARRIATFLLHAAAALTPELAA